MIPLLFGASERSLLGVYTPGVAPRKRRAAVICPPLGQEYMRSHRTCRILASRLGEAGIDAFRFDYFGTGDSGGEVEDLSLEGAVHDARAAIQEVMDVASVRRVTLVGLRLGALIASHAAVGIRAVDRLVLWDPVADGAQYVRDLMGADATVARRGDRRVDGFVFTGSLQDDLLGASLLAADLPSQVLTVVSEDLPRHRALRDSLSARLTSAKYEHLPNPPSWTEVGNIGVGAVPSDIITRITQW